MTTLEELAARVADLEAQLNPTPMNRARAIEAKLADIAERNRRRTDRLRGQGPVEPGRDGGADREEERHSGAARTVGPNPDAAKGANPLGDRHGRPGHPFVSVGTFSPCIVELVPAGRGERECGHSDSSTSGRPDTVLTITVEVRQRRGVDSRPCACGGAAS